MGSWGYGPFDSDSAADWAYQVRAASGPPARTDVLTMAMRVLVDAPVEFSLHPMETCELDSIVEHAVAAVAYVADGVTGRCHHTNTTFAIGCAEETPYNLLPPPKMERVSPATHALAMAVLDRVEHLLVTDPDSGPYRKMLATLRADLATYNTPAPGTDTAPARKLTEAADDDKEGTPGG